MTAERIARMVRAAALVAALVLVAVGPAAGRGFMSKEFASPEARPHTVAVLSPHADFIKANVVMTESMIKECEALEREAAEAIQARLEAMGHTVIVVTPERLQASLDLRELATRVDLRYEEEKAHLARKPRQVKERRYGVGEDAVLLASLLEADALVVSRIQAIWVSGGRKALGVIFGGVTGYPRSRAYVDMTIIDGATGKVDLFFFGGDQCKSKALVDDPGKVMGKAFDSCFRSFPPLGTAVVAKDDEADDEAILAEFEALAAEEEEKKEGDDRGAGEEEPAEEDDDPPGR